MVIVHISAGLGNQMFQYALYRSFVAQGIKTLVELTAYSTRGERRDYLLPAVFDLHPPVAAAWQLGLMKVYSKLRYKLLEIPYKEQEGNFGKYNAAVNKVTSGYINGYWQSESYFSAFENEIRKDFTFPAVTEAHNRALLQKINSVNAVSVHVRRTDYTEHANWLLPLSYYQQAMNLIKEKIEKPLFFIFSDDIEWARKNFPADCVFVEGNSADKSFRDMQLMSCCRHHIIANSSFSWWGAWLNPSSDKVVIAPDRWIPAVKGTGDIIPASWIQLPA